MEYPSKTVRKTRSLVPAVGLLVGWILGQLGLFGLVLAVISLVVIAHSRGYRVTIERINEDD